jgi:TonB-linked SusC/RagA family outer membrane protein
VKDQQTGEALPGVNVVVKGTTVGTATDLDGKYSVNVPTDGILAFSYVGYLTEEVPVNNQSEINIALVPNLQSLEEVVVVGYGVMKKSDVTGSIVSIADDDLKQVKSTSVIESIQGKAAGIDITKSKGEAGTGLSIKVRGERSLSGENDPLYIVDGVQYGSGININPNDIESMEILKDVASTAIYGSRGANGVIIITTKKGTEGRSRVTYSNYISFNRPLGSLPYTDRDSYIQFKEDLARIGVYNKTGDWPDSVGVNYEPFEEEGIQNGTNTDWFGEIVRTGIVQDHFLGVSGGNSGVTYNVSADYTDEKGMLKGDHYKRYVLNANLDAKVSKRLTAGTSTILSMIDRDRMTFPEKSLTLMNPLAVPYDSIGEIIDLPIPKSGTLSPLYYFKDGRYENNELTTRVFSNLYFNINFFEGLNLKSNFNADINNYRKGRYESAFTGTEVEMYISPHKDFTWSNILTFDKEYNVHHIQFTGVHEMLWGNRERYTLVGDNPEIINSYWYGLQSISIDNITDYDANNLESDTKKEYTYEEGSLLSFLGRVNYSLMGKYVLTASLRRDGSSRLSHENNNNWDMFPAFSVAWNASEESFIKSVGAISSLKLRLSYGVSGNYAVPVYASVSKTNVSPLYYEFGVNETPALGYRPVETGNNSLGWEKTASYNIGVDFGLLNNRLSGNVDIYKAKTTDILQQRALPAHTAIAFIYDNVGETETNGIELMLHSVNVSSKGNGFKWTTDLTFTRNREKITKLARGVEKDEQNGWFVGEPLAVYYDYEKIGIWQFADSVELELFNSKGAKLKPGDIKIKDQDGDTLITEDDRIVLGHQRPDWYGGLTNKFAFKGFDLSIFIVARMGQMVRDNVMWGYQNRDSYSEGGFKADYWTPINPTNEQPLFNPSQSAVSYMPYASTLRYTDGSWIKVRDITLGYTLPAKISGKIKISSFRVYVSLKNYFVLYSPLFDKERYDPESNGGTSWPTPKSVITGLTVEF